MLPSSAPPPGWAVELLVPTWPPMTVFYVRREHVRGILTFLSSLGRMWGSCHLCLIVLGACLLRLSHGFVTKQACLVLWLSKPAH